MRDLIRQRDSSGKDFDTVAEYVVQRNDEMQERMLSAFPWAPNRPLAILDIGCGSGHLSRLLLEKYPNARVVGIDFSEVMIDKCHRSLRRFGNRVELVCEDIMSFRPSFAFDAVVSVMTIHNLVVHDQRELLTRLGSWVLPGGVFVNGDFIMGEIDAAGRWSKEMYIRHVESSHPPEAVGSRIEHINREDSPLKLSKQDQTLQNAGFNGIRLLWLFANQAVYSAQRKPYLS